MEKREDYIRHKNAKGGSSSTRGWIVKNLLAAVAVVVAIMLAATLTLSLITQHGRQILVPDFGRLTLREATLLASEGGMRAEVVDSIYVKRLPRGCVVRQEPKAGSMVKKGRRIHLTINAVNPRMVPMPDLVGFSLRSAKAEIRTRGLVLGRLVYVQDIATNNVLRQLSGGRDISSGQMLPGESVIDLVLGLNPVENLTQTPDVKGLTLANAESVVQDHSLNIGRRIYDRSVVTYQDSLAALVYSQDPDPVEGSVLMGRNVNLYLTIDTSKIPAK